MKTEPNISEEIAGILAGLVVLIIIVVKTALVALAVACAIKYLRS